MHEVPDGIRGTAHRALCQGREQASRAKRQVAYRKNRQAICHRCCACQVHTAVPWGLPQRTRKNKVPTQARVSRERTVTEAGCWDASIRVNTCRYVALLPNHQALYNCNCPCFLQIFISFPPRPLRPTRTLGIMPSSFRRFASPKKTWRSYSYDERVGRNPPLLNGSMLTATFQQYPRKMLPSTYPV